MWFQIQVYTLIWIRIQLLNFNADLDPNPAPHQSDRNLRTLVYRAQFLSLQVSIVSVYSTALHGSILSLQPLRYVFGGTGKIFYLFLSVRFRLCLCALGPG
jgi:hypothetical protein